MSNNKFAVGKNGSKYELEIYPIGTSFNNIGGIYFFLKQNTKGEYIPIYIGQTGNFNERLNVNLKNHNAWSCCKQNGATHFGLHLHNGSEQSRISIETDLRHNYNTACNIQ